tara:strand:+ start:16 stop:402 length:387 start_codon:yes stop_codon:yes gene_type:complete
MINSIGNIKFLDSHEWVKFETDGTVLVGISDYAQEQLGDIVFIELPEIGKTFTSKEEVAVVESVKAASDIYSPISGEIIEINENLLTSPEIVNSSPYEEGWFYKMEPSNELDFKNLLSLEQYNETNKA